jgi:hypothetical protein
MPFTFDLGTSSCNTLYFREYTVEVTKAGVTVVSPAWLTLTQDSTNIPQTLSPSLTVNSSNAADAGTYLVTLKSQLYAEVAE